MEKLDQGPARIFCFPPHRKNVHSCPMFLEKTGIFCRETGYSYGIPFFFVRGGSRSLR